MLTWVAKELTLPDASSQETFNSSQGTASEVSSQRSSSIMRSSSTSTISGSSQRTSITEGSSVIGGRRVRGEETVTQEKASESLTQDGMKRMKRFLDEIPTTTKKKRRKNDEYTISTSDDEYSNGASGVLNVSQG